MVTKRKARRTRRSARRRNRARAKYTPKINPRRRRRVRRTRRNSWVDNAAGHAKAARKGWKRRRAKLAGRKRTRRNPVYKINRRRRRHARRNPVGLVSSVKRTFSKNWLMDSATIAAGIIAAFVGKPVVYKLIPDAQKETVRPYLGLVHLLLGSLLYGFTRNRSAKQVGMVLAGAGVYDLIASNVQALSLPAIPVTNAAIDKVIGGGAVSASYDVGRRPVSRVASVGVPMLSASYEAPGARTAGLGSTWMSDEWTTDSPYAGVFE